MTPKEKAEYLIDTFRMVLMNEDTDCGNEILCTIIATKLAVLTAEEVISQWEYIDTYLADLDGKLNPNLDYWSEVKNRIVIARA